VFGLTVKRNTTTGNDILNLFENALEQKSTPDIEAVARDEGADIKDVIRGVAAGKIAVMTRKGQPALGIGEGLRTKVNANIGTSAESVHEKEEVEKARVAEFYGAHTVSDLSMGGDIDGIREGVRKATTVPLTTVPIYQAIVENKGFKKVTSDDLFDMVRRHISEGISSIVIHAGFTLKTLDRLRGQQRIMGMVSKGGSFTSVWMLENEQENPYLDRFDDLLDILAGTDVVLSLGNTMRSGCIHDLMDPAQEDEIRINADLARRANARGVQVIIEGLGGHVNPRDIGPYVKKYKDMTDSRPLFAAGPLPTDIAVGYDHIAAAVGGALAAGAGVDYLCYITPAEHLSLPNLEQVREGVVAARIGAHIGDSLKFGLSESDRELARSRRLRDWEKQFEIAIDGSKAKEMHPNIKSKTCSMCGKYCAIKIMEKYLG
jgi:phosphomethylpyrimidine synthase